MLDSTRQFIDVLEREEIKYIFSESNEDMEDETVRIQFGAENIASIVVLFFFDADCESAAIRIFNLLKFPDGKEEEIMRAVCNANMRFRFAKFCIDFDDNTVQMEMDAAFRSHDVGEICHELMYRSVGICDEAYKDFMKAIWS